MIRSALKIGVLAVTTILVMGCESTSDAPKVSEDGLELKVDKRSTIAYKKEGVDFSQYNKVKIMPSQVAFRENWKRNYNRSQSSLSNRVKDEDMLRIKNGVAKLFDEVFKDEFGKNDVNIVETVGTGTLIIKPAIINLDVSAPDLRTAANIKTYTQEAGEATLFLELYDGVSGEILARIIDAEVIGDRGYTQWANRVTNTADAKRAIRKWAKALRESYEKAHKQ